MATHFHRIEVPVVYDPKSERRIHLTYRDNNCGSKKPILFLAPFGGTTEIWQPFQPTYFVRNGYRFLALDIRGHGMSDGSAKEQGEYSIPLFARDVATFIDTLGLESVDLVGASMGGMIALEYAHMHPERIYNLVLVGSYAGSLQHNEASFLEDHELIKQHGIKGLRKIKDKDASYFGKPYNAMSIDERIAADAYFNQLKRMRIEEYIATDLAIARKPDQQAYLQELGNALPNRVLFVAGENDFFREAQDEMHTNTPHSKLEIIADAGHFCWSHSLVESEFACRVFSFLNE